MKKEAYLYEQHPSGDVTCHTCQRGCHIPEGETGWCRTRRNERGKLYSLIYGEVSVLSNNPIEKKPVYHFFPGSRWLSLGTVGCNFRCPGCQNWDISHWIDGPMHTRYLSPEEAVVEAKARGSIGLSWTFNEPAIWFEYTLDGARAAKAAGLYTNYVTNGSISEQAFDLITPYLDVYRVDIKGFSDSTYSQIGHIENLDGILHIAHKAKQCGMHVEVVTNIMPGINDSEEELRGIAAWVHDTLGPETPWHVTRFFPYLKLAHLPPTPIETLEKAYIFGKEAGLWYVYLGNVPGHEWENTYCHSCGKLLIQRYVFDIVENRLSDGRCPNCHSTIPGSF